MHATSPADLGRGLEPLGEPLARQAIALDHAPRPSAGLVLTGAAQMSEREGRKFFFLLQAILAALFLIVGVALAVEAASGGYGIGLVIVTVMANGPGFVFFILAELSAATAMHLRP